MITVDINEAAELLRQHDNILIIMHRSPDGDTIGSAYALCAALRMLGKNADTVCADDIPPKYDYITSKLPHITFEPQYIVSTDIAGEQLFGEELAHYAAVTDLCIDHHGSNTGFARYGIVDASAGACTQIISKVISALGVTPDKFIADAIFTGISTDTGCFKYSNATAESYRIAADMLDFGADGATINRVMFDTKSRARIELERLVLDSVRFYENDRIAVIFITAAMLAQTGADDGDTEGIAGIPRRIEGVKAGITIKEKESGVYRISLRTTADIDAAAVCRVFDGGGHKAAAGCTLCGDADDVCSRIVAETAKQL